MNATGTSSACELKTGEAPQPERARLRPAGSILIATGNRTTGAVLHGLLQNEGRSARWAARKDFETEIIANHSVQEDAVLVEVDSLEAVAAMLAVTRDPESLESVALIAVIPESRPDLRAACERGGFEGCLSAPIDPAALFELIDAVLDRIRPGLEGLEPGSETSSESEGPEGRNAIVNRRALDDLAGLGGSAFVRDIVAQFVEDASSVLTILHEAVRTCDAAVFRDQAHALRSCAANVGANGVYATCLAWREIQPAELAAQGEAYMKRLELEFRSACDVLQDYLKQN